tara:strand:+ start:60 stop:332 length:273 start_codon:yes stop_codon:yes gene_type:complete
MDLNDILENDPLGLLGPLIWTKHSLSSEYGPYYMGRKDKGSYAEYYAAKERGKWVAYDLLNRECELVGTYKTLSELKKAIENRRAKWPIR